MREFAKQKWLISKGLYVLEFRRIMGNVKQTYGMLRELEKVDFGIFSLLGESQTRGHNYKLRNQPF